MTEFAESFSTYCQEAEFHATWAFPVCTLIFIWALTTVGVKIFAKRGKLKTVFVINRAWIVSSLIMACILIVAICFGWLSDFFAQRPWQLSLLISLTLAMLIPTVSLIRLRKYYSPEEIKVITDQPKTEHQLNLTVGLTKKAFAENKLYFLIPLSAFSLLFLHSYNFSTNLITLVYDNSPSMEATTALDALSETFSNLEPNNEIVLTTLEGYSEADSEVVKTNLKDIMQAGKSSDLKGGSVVLFLNPEEAKNGLNKNSKSIASPICEAIWKTYLAVQETKANQTYRKKVLIIITDGKDYIDPSLASGKFLFDDEKFFEFYLPENTFVIDYSSPNEARASFLQRCKKADCNVYTAENGDKQAYLDALDNALQSLKRNWFLIYWTASIFSLLAIIALMIHPPKIV